LVLEDFTMPLFLISLSIGFVVRFLRKTADVPIVFRRRWLLGLALGLQIGVVPALSGPSKTIVLFVSLGAAVGWLVHNVVRANSEALRFALLMIAAGAFMNIVPTLSHGAMPVDREALRSVGFVRGVNSQAPGTKHVIVAGSASFLGDRFPIRSLNCVVSLGDFAEMLGIALLITALPKRPQSSRAPKTSISIQGPLTT
jgi:Family of unknown function (DUF5317)